MARSGDKLTVPDAGIIQGFDQINAEHQALAAMTDRLRSAIAGLPDRRMPFDEFETAAREIVDAMREHFVHEEQTMQQTGYPSLAQHRAHHAGCLVKLRTLMSTAASQGHATEKTVDTVFATLIDDVLKADLDFKTFLYDKGLIR
jgi:hemerythrin-like metal-binding protein